MSEEGHDVDEGEVLPVEAYKDELMQTIRDHQIVICQGETGSGKTTKIPQYFMESSMFAEDKMIGITQPRRIAAITVAQRVAEERACRLGEEVGYCVRFDDMTSAVTKAKFMTDGILVRECLSDPLLTKYSAIMLDEAHERSISTDVLFGLVKNACKRRPDLKLVITSATLDELKFSAYFNNCPVINIPGRMYHVDLYHSKIRQVMTATGPSNSSYVDSCVKTVLKIHNSPDRGHILVFLTGQDEIERACQLLESSLDELSHGAKKSHDLVVIPLYASMPPNEQRKAFASYGRKRKCVIATNIAETSVTVPGIRFVVDSGYVKQKCYDPSRRMESLIVVPISKVSAQQRAGRAGRTGPGQCYRLYSSECYAQFGAETIPEIKRCNLSNTLLYLKILGIHDVMGFEFMDPPSPQQIAEGLVILHLLGALDDTGRVTSPVGKGMALYPLDPSLSRMLVEASRRENNCFDEVTKIAAMLSVEEIFHYPRRRRHRDGSTDAPSEEQSASEFAHDGLRHSKGDHFTYLNIFEKFEASDEKFEWCEKHYIKFRAMKTATKIRNQLMSDSSKLESLHQNDGQASSERSRRDRVKAIQQSIAAGLHMNVGRKCGNGLAYRSLPLPLSLDDADEITSEDMLYTLRDMLEEVKLLHLHPTASLGGSSGNAAPDCLVYQDLIFSGRILMKHVTTIDISMVQGYRKAWSFVHPSVLSGRESPKKKKRKSADIEGCCTSETVEDSAGGNGGPPSAAQKLSRVEQARARFLKRKIEKS